MSTKSDKEKDEKKPAATTASGDPLAAGQVVPAPQDPDLAEKGIYQPSDSAANAARVESEEVADEQAAYAKNLASLPPVPSDRAGAASQAK